MNIHRILSPRAQYSIAAVLGAGAVALVPNAHPILSALLCVALMGLLLCLSARELKQLATLNLQIWTKQNPADFWITLGSAAFLGCLGLTVFLYRPSEISSPSSSNVTSHGDGNCNVAGNGNQVDCARTDTPDLPVSRHPGVEITGGKHIKIGTINTFGMPGFKESGGEDVSVGSVTATTSVPSDPVVTAHVPEFALESNRNFVDSVHKFVADIRSLATRFDAEQMAISGAAFASSKAHPSEVKRIYSNMQSKLAELFAHQNEEFSGRYFSKAKALRMELLFRLGSRPFKTNSTDSIVPTFFFVGTIQGSGAIRFLANYLEVRVNALPE